MSKRGSLRKRKLRRKFQIFFTVLISLFLCIDSKNLKDTSKTCKDKIDEATIKSFSNNLFAYENATQSTLVSSTVGDKGTMFTLSKEESSSSSMIISSINLQEVSLNWAIKIDTNLEVIAVTPEEDTLIAGDVGEGVGTSFKFYFWDISTKEAIFNRSIEADSYSQPFKSPQITPINSTHLVAYGFPRENYQDLLFLDFTNLDTISIEHYGEPNHDRKMIYNQEFDSLIVILHYENITDPTIHIQEYKVQSLNRVRHAYIRCDPIKSELQSSGFSTECVPNLVSAMEMNENKTKAYVLGNIFTTETIFITIDFDSSKPLYDDLRIVPVKEQGSIDILAKNEFVYLLSGKPYEETLIMIYDTSTKAFINDRYESRIFYSKVHSINSEIFLISNYNRHLSIAQTDQDLFYFHTDFEKNSSSLPKIYKSEYNDTQVYDFSPPQNTTPIFTPSAQSPDITELSPLPKTSIKPEFSLKIAIFNNSKEVHIGKSVNKTVAYCPIISLNDPEGLTYTYEYTKDDQTDYSFWIHPSEGNLGILNKGHSIIEKESTYVVTVSPKDSKMGREEEIVIKERVNEGDQGVMNRVKTATLVIGVVVVFLSSILGGNLIQGVYMIFNQIKLLILFLLIDTYIHPTIRFMITVQSFVLWDFKFMTKWLPSFLTSPPFIDGLFSNSQSTESLKEIQIENESTLRQYWVIILLLFFLVISLVLINLIRSCKSSSKCAPINQNNEEEKTEIEHEGGCMEKYRVDNSAISQPETPNHNPGGGMSSCNVDFRNEIGSENQKENEQKETFWKFIKKSIGSYLTLKMVKALYFRMMIESFLGVLIVGVNELKTNPCDTTNDKWSYILCILILFVYFLFYIFVWYICFEEYNLRKDCLKKIEEQGENDERCQETLARTKDEEEALYYHELIKDLDPAPFAVFHTPLVLTRILTFVIFIMVLDIFSPKKIWMLFILLLSVQAVYLYQAWRVPKFENGAVRAIYLVNEAFLLLFILLFSLFRTFEDYQNSMANEFIIFMFFMNTSIVIGLQMLAYIIERKKRRKGDKEDSKEEVKTNDNSQQIHPAEYIPAEVLNFKNVESQSSLISEETKSPPTPLSLKLQKSPSPPQSPLHKAIISSNSPKAEIAPKKNPSAKKQPPSKSPYMIPMKMPGKNRPESVEERKG